MIARHSSWMPPMNRITDDDRGEALGRERGIDDPCDDLDDQAERGDDHDEHGQRGDQIKRRVGERDDRPARPAEVLAQRVGGAPEHPLRPDVRDPELLEADPRAQTAQEAVLLGQRVHRVDDTSVDQAEVAGIEGHVHVGQTLEDPVERLGRRNA